jgi:hypothetical protein
MKKGAPLFSPKNGVSRVKRQEDKVKGYAVYNYPEKELNRN